MGAAAVGFGDEDVLGIEVGAGGGGVTEGVVVMVGIAGGIVGCGCDCNCGVDVVSVGFGEAGFSDSTGVASEV